MPSVKALGHVGLYCTDLKKSKDFYTRILGLVITDESSDGQMTFLSAQPNEEHHELALCTGRDVAPGAKVIQQVSFIVESLDTLKRFHELLEQEKVRIRNVVTHGIAFSIYFYDPDDNVIEIYAKTPYKVTQPVSEPIDLTLSESELMSLAERGGQP